MPPADDKVSLHAYLTPEAYEGWQDFGDEHGCPVSALVESLGLTLREMAEKPLSEEWRIWVKDAKYISAMRRRRS